MFKKLAKRCVASLLCVVIGGWVLLPSTVLAAQTSMTKPSTKGGVIDVYSNLKAQVNKYPFYYKEGSKNGSSKVNELEVFHMWSTQNKFEVFAWANPKVDSVKSDIKNYIGLDVAGLYRLGKLDTSLNPNFTDSFLSNIDESLGSGIADTTELMKSLNSLHMTQGASSADLSNLNQRMAAFLYYRLNPELLLDNGKLIWDDVTAIDNSDYSDMLTNTLNQSHDTRFREQLETIGILKPISEVSDTDVKDNGNVHVEQFVFSLNQTGLLAIDTTPLKPSGSGNSMFVDNEEKVYDKDNKVFIANEFAIYMCLSEFAAWYLEEMPRVVSSAGWETNEEVQGTLTFLRIFYDTFGTYIPVVKSIYEYSNADADNLSIKDMVERAAVGDTKMEDAFKVTTSAYNPHTDKSSPIAQFYTANSSVGILSYQRDVILGDIDVDKTYDELLKDEREYKKHDESVSGDEDAFEIDNTFLTSQSTVADSMVKLFKETSKEYDKNRNKLKDNLKKKSNKLYKQYKKLFTDGQMNVIMTVLYDHYGDPWASTIKGYIDEKDWFNLFELFGQEQLKEVAEISKGDFKSIESYLKSTTKENKKALTELAENSVDFGVDSDGVASSLNSVVINKNIVEGMGYSTTYIPMRTNVYNADVISMYKGNSEENTEFYEFYKTYGFMRKALLKDTSSSSAMDYYNAGGKLTNTLKVCTLRDLLYSGNQDVTLYLDSGFYNAEQAVKDGNKLLESTRKSRKSLEADFIEFTSLWKNSSTILGQGIEAVKALGNGALRFITLGMLGDDDPSFDDIRKEFRKGIMNTYKFDINKFEEADDMKTYTDNLINANERSDSLQLSLRTLKADGNPIYDNFTRAELASVKNADYVNLSSGSDSGFVIDKSSKTLYTDDNPDTIVLTSSQINEYISGQTTYSDSVVNEDKTEKTTNTYTSDTGYSPMMSLAFVSCLYRNTNNYLLSNTVEDNNPVFMASDDLCGIEEANQWYRNTLINYALMKNLIANAQVDISFVTDLDCPVYMDIFGNILTESGIVVIPAASNATLHPGSFKGYNFAVGLYSVYGKEYYVPSDTKGAMSVMYPYFVSDDTTDNLVVSGVTMQANNVAVRFDKLDTYDDATKKAVRDAYKASIATKGTTRLNWMALVKIANEVMRGAPIENIDKATESLYIDSSKSSLIAAAKLESLLDSFAGESSNTLLCIPDFSRMDNMEYWVALLIKLVAVVTCGVIIVAVYRDGISNNLGIKTFTKSLLAIALTVSCIVVVPAIFQLTYYSTNKLFLENEILRILMVNEEKRQGGEEIGVTDIDTVESTGEFAVQLDWIQVPWYEKMENMMFGSTLDNLQEEKLKAYRETPTYDNKDVSVYNDGVYVTTDNLFDSVAIDYTFKATGSTRGLYLNTQDTTQTASFYSPYYVFLRVLTANVNEYNRWLNNGSDIYTSEEAAKNDADNDKLRVLGSYNYTTKYMSGERLKTVGLCEAYFESINFMQDDSDLLRLDQIYMADDETADNEQGPAANVVKTRERATGRSMIFSDEERAQFRKSYWYDNEAVFTDMEYYNKVRGGRLGAGDNAEPVTKAEMQERYLNKVLSNYDSCIEAMDGYARDFVARNKDMLGKISDETFIKTMALAMSIKYNQLFGVNSANSIEIFNMDSEDLLRLCLVPSDQAVISTSMSYSRFVYTFGGESGVYLAAILSVIMWVGSFIKPLCTVIVFISVFMSIFVFKVVLGRPSANMWGYFVTCTLLCFTNVLHAFILKIGVSLPGIGLSTVGCLVFITFGQVVYLLLLSYITGVSLKDWSNLGASTYEKEAKLIKSKFVGEDTSAMMSGNIKHYSNNWDYYNDLVEQHRERNKLT